MRPLKNMISYNACLSNGSKAHLYTPQNKLKVSSRVQGHIK
jgi:hypothetical protein